MADLAWFSALLVLFCSSPGISREPPFFAREREKHLSTFSVHVRLMVLELASLEKKKKERKKMTQQYSICKALLQKQLEKALPAIWRAVQWVTVHCAALCVRQATGVGLW